MELIQKLWPEVFVTSSIEVTKEWREYERTSTIALNSYVMPVASSYIDNLDRRLKEAGCHAKEYIMQSNGGTTTFEQAKQVIPGGIEHNLANNHPFPISIDRADGPYLYDEDGNRYYDLLMAGGPTILGNNYFGKECAAFIQEKGPLSGLYSEYERKLANLVCRY